MSSIVTPTLDAAASSTATPGFSEAVISATASSSVASSSPGISYYVCPQTYHASTVIGAVFGGVALGMLIAGLIGLFIVWRQKRLVWKNSCQCRSATTHDSETRSVSDGTLVEKTGGYTLEYGKALGYEKRMEYEKTVDFGRSGHESDDGPTLQGSVMH